MLSIQTNIIHSKLMIFHYFTNGMITCRKWRGGGAGVDMDAAVAVAISVVAVIVRVILIDVIMTTMRRRM